MKKKTKLIVILSSVLGVVFAAVLTLSLITVRPLESMGQYKADKIRVLDSYDTQQRVNDELLGKAMNTVKFSVMRSLLELSADYNIKPVKTTDENGDRVNAYLTAEGFKGVRPTNGEFMLRLSYDAPYVTNKHFVDENGDKIKYDTVVVIIPKSRNTISEIKLYPYLEYNLDNQNGDLDKYDDDGRIGMTYARVYQFTAKAYTYKMYDILDDEYTPAAIVAPQTPDDPITE